MQFSYKKWKKQLMSDEVKAFTILSFPAIQLLDINVLELISSSDNQAKAMLEIAKKLPDQAAIVGMMDLSLEAEAFGSKVDFSDNEVPVVIGSIINNLEDAQKLDVPTLDAGRLQVYLDAISKVVREKEDERPVFAGTIGPFSLVGRLMDVSEAMIQCLMDPEYVKTVLVKVTAFLKEYIREYKKIGANGVLIAEPLAGLMSPNLIYEFSSVYIKEIVDELQSDDFVVIYHNCGDNTTKAIDEIVSTGCSMYHFGNSIDMEEVITKIPSDFLAMGNIDPVKYFKNGSVKEMDEAVETLLSKCGSYPNFIISSGCDIPPLAKWENIEQFYRSVNEYNSRRKSL